MSSLQDPKIILKGSIDITDNLAFVMDMISIGNLNLVIINLDEYNNQIQGECVIQGAELLPPPAAVIAEQDGDMQAYDYIYDNWYSEPAIQLFMTGIITTLYKGKNILLYYPELNNAESITIPKLLEIFWIRFGIKIGIVNINSCMYNFKLTPIWLNLMYHNRVLGAYEYLLEYPTDAIIQAPEMAMLVDDIRPPEQDKVKAILDYRKKIISKPETVRVFYSITPGR